MGSTRYLVVPSSSPSGWAVKADGKASATFKTKGEALMRAKSLAAQSGGELVVYGRDGKIQSATTRPRGYGSLRGRFVPREGIDLSKPIYEQVREKPAAKR